MVDAPFRECRVLILEKIELVKTIVERNDIYSVVQVYIPRSARGSYRFEIQSFWSLYILILGVIVFTWMWYGVVFFFFFYLFRFVYIFVVCLCWSCGCLEIFCVYRVSLCAGVFRYTFLVVAVLLSCFYVFYLNASANRVFLFCTYYVSLYLCIERNVLCLVQ